MKLLVHDIMVGDKTPEENTAKVWAEIKVEYDLLNTPGKRFGSMQLSMFSPKGVTLILSF